MSELNTFFYYKNKMYKVLKESKSLYYLTGYECLIDKTMMAKDRQIKTYFSMYNVDFKSKVKLYYTKFLKCQRFKNLSKVYLLSDNIIDEYKNLLFSICECPICYAETKNYIGLYECSHLLCKNCFNKWSETQLTCPLCRSR